MKKVFNENLKLFLHFWGSREAGFTTYFKQNYASRTGGPYFLLRMHILYPSLFFILEKWALCYGHYEHKTQTPTCLLKGII